MEEEKKVSDESIVEEAKGETLEETTTEDGTEAKETKETKTKKKKKSAAALEIELKKSEEKAAEMTDKYQRLMAEFENARKRNAKEQSHMYDVGAKEVLAKLLPVVEMCIRDRFWKFCFPGGHYVFDFFAGTIFRSGI